MNSLLVECMKQFHKVVNVHSACSFFTEFYPVEYLINKDLDVQVGIDSLIGERTMNFEVLLQHEGDGSL